MKKTTRIALYCIAAIVYISLLIVARTSNTISQHKDVVGTVVLATPFFLFILCMVISGILHPRYGTPQSKREELGETFGMIAGYIRWVILLSLPLYITIISR